jgi:two-component system response regulator YesN
MHRLLVVDDEPFIVNGLYEFLLMASGLELDVYKAYSGDEAVEWLHRTKIDIVITDIRMPGMTGIQLLDQIKRQWPHCRVIFLSGYTEFEYVYQAIQHEGVGYLLKTAGYDKILELVKKAVSEIEEMVSTEDFVAKARRQMKIALPTLQKDMLLGLLRGETGTLEMRSEQFRHLEISLRPQDTVLLCWVGSNAIRRSHLSIFARKRSFV